MKKDVKTIEMFDESQLERSAEEKKARVWYCPVCHRCNSLSKFVCPGKGVQMIEYGRGSRGPARYECGYDSRTRSINPVAVGS